jgi:hypothetical protein
MPATEPSGLGQALRSDRFSNTRARRVFEDNDNLRIKEVPLCFVQLKTARNSGRLLFHVWWLYSRSSAPVTLTPKQSRLIASKMERPMAGPPLTAQARRSPRLLQRRSGLRDADQRLHGHAGCRAAL